MGVSRTLVDIWEKFSEAWRKDKEFYICLMVVQRNFDPYSYPLSPFPAETCIILHIIQKQNQTILYSLKMFQNFKSCFSSCKVSST